MLVCHRYSLTSPHLTYTEMTTPSHSQPDIMSDPAESTSPLAPRRPPLGFLSLPPEIRLQIYALLLILPPYSKYDLPPCDYHHHHNSSSSHSSPSPPSQHHHAHQQVSQKQHQHQQHDIHPALLQTCRLIHLEASPILYSLNTFVAHPSLLASFPRLRPRWRGGPVREARALARLRRFHLTLRLDCDLPFSRDRAARAFSGADALVVDAVQAVFLGVGCANLRVLEGVRGVGRARVVGSTTGFEDYVRWLEGVMMSPPGVEVVAFKGERGDGDGSDALSHRLNVHVWPVAIKEIEAHG
ncbi:hypothetical protein JDV02_005284 [Purpureocillium takamizusanense]|uniref:DUF7730 domain-containing protein n=1 Tax=Purpureocillium takamizusanense TaxID=2060973 RepID=A0A9Q8VBR3_9HYPO|nr:uncharacterized protein JDV02_005284 [Purpureocillium takamizusanense]UNI19067.1 hypothetical protein JDV02_005284 [Purpureocillium takamizusanense]